MFKKTSRIGVAIVDVSQRTDSILTCLGHPYRRETVTIITETNEPITTTELAREIATRSGQVPSDDGDSDLAESIQLELYHGHLPKLAEADLIEYNQDANLVSSASTTTHLTALVQIAYSIAEVT